MSIINYNNVSINTGRIDKITPVMQKEISNSNGNIVTKYYYQFHMAGKVIVSGLFNSELEAESDRTTLIGQI